MTLINDYVKRAAFSTVSSFWVGLLGGTAIQAGGKLWTVFVNPAQNATKLLGHIATPVFQRQLAVGFCVYGLCVKLFLFLGVKICPDWSGLKGRGYIILTNAISIAIASAAATLILPLHYDYMLGFMTIVTAAYLGKKIFDKIKA